VNFFVDMDRRGLILPDDSSQTETATPAVRREEPGPFVAPTDWRLAPLAERWPCQRTVRHHALER
jgi:hypothetical protein